MIEINSPYKVVEVLFQRRYPGYVYRRELIDDSDMGGDGDLEMVNCYSDFSGDWIGNAKTARSLCKERSIRFVQKREPSHCVCSIGFNPDEQKWYGWSHRACFGFGIGSKVKKDNCAYQPKDKEDYREEMIRFWDSEHHVETTGEFRKEGVQITWIYDDKVPNKKLRGTTEGSFCYYPSKWGKGEWKAITLEDAKQMAMDFAEGIS